MSAVAIDIVADLVKHRSRGKPFCILRRQTVKRFQSLEQVHGELPDLQSVVHIHAVMGNGRPDRVPALRFDVFSGTGAAVVLGGQLRQQTVAQSQRRVAEARQLAAFEKLGVDHRSCHYDFGAPWSDAGKLLALCHRKARQHFCDGAHLGARDRSGARTFRLVQAMTDCGQGSCGSRGRDHDSRPRPFDPVGDPPDFSFHESSQTPQFRFARRIVRQKLVGQTHRAQRQADGVADMAFAGNGQLTASPAQVDHESGRGTHAQT